ncbi:hypothetical protein AM501_29370 [Aneurinibacillus migulanus]|uniref:DUF6262 family protein n=1 Tax=Aneurinibacillus migulanus TaxID=47500 RepID=UPI0005BBDB32|nr:DUF6262 family protein [Aneurinibacillus migulanus]KIV51570.1 hypothetical protein TS64_23480 [Aneurinibacillus migulanus]KPD04887.1 hypothetical protein AM501_29370 [Aneurinibacillus migulanus]
MRHEANFNLAEFNRKRTTEKVVLALKALKKSKKEITIDLVSKMAGISRKTLYNREDLMIMVKEAKSLQHDKINSQPKPKKSTIQEERIASLRKENLKLNEEMKRLLEQNMHLTRTVMDLERRLERIYEQSQLLNLK